MIRRTVAVMHGREVVALDSASQIESDDRGRIVIAGSNGGRESGKAAIEAGCYAVVLNDAGIGKGRAGVAGLPMLDDNGISGMAVSHDSAEISDGLSTWNDGVLTTVNEVAKHAGVRIGMSVPEAIRTLFTHGNHEGAVHADPR
ncbi:MAG: hypothetical protein ACTH1G_04770 [Microbacterium gubbeenense]